MNVDIVFKVCMVVIGMVIEMVRKLANVKIIVIKVYMMMVIGMEKMVVKEEITKNEKRNGEKNKCERNKKRVTFFIKSLDLVK